MLTVVTLAQQKGKVHAFVRKHTLETAATRTEALSLTLHVAALLLKLLHTHVHLLRLFFLLIHFEQARAKRKSKKEHLHTAWQQYSPRHHDDARCTEDEANLSSTHTHTVQRAVSCSTMHARVVFSTSGLARHTEFRKQTMRWGEEKKFLKKWSVQL